MSGTERLPDSWVWTPLAELLFGIEAGKSFKCDERPPQTGEVGVVKVISLYTTLPVQYADRNNR